MNNKLIVQRSERIWGKTNLQGSYLGSRQQVSSLCFETEPWSMFLFKLSKSAVVSILQSTTKSKNNYFFSLLSFSHCSGIQVFGSNMFTVPSSYLNLNTARKHITDWMLPVLPRQSPLTEPYHTSSIQRNPRLALINYGTKSISRANKSPKKRKGVCQLLRIIRNEIINVTCLRVGSVG